MSKRRLGKKLPIYNVLEDKIFAAITNSAVPQSAFNSLLHEWVKSASPSVVGTKIPRKQRKGNTTFLSGQYSPTLAKISANRIDELGFSNIGIIVQPITYQYLRSAIAKDFESVAIDNGMFTQAGRNNFTWDKYEKMVKVALAQEKREIIRELSFFTIPDEPFDWKATLAKFEKYKAGVQVLRSYGAPAAVVLQNGATSETVPWNEIDVVFIGGDDKWKTGAEAKQIIQEAKNWAKTRIWGV